VIRLHTLGSIDLQSSDDEQLGGVIAQPKRLALFAYLALSRPFGFHRRDRVIAMFWPEQDDAHARDSLNQAIRFLRQSLGSSVILSRGAEDIGLDRTRVWCDAIEFQAAIDGGRQRDAIELYRGDLLAGLFVSDLHGFDEWLEGERTRLREQASHAARTVAEREEVAGNVTHALRWGRLSVSLSNGDERTLRRWLGMLARAGDRSGAIRAYEEFARRFREEYGADPSPETQALVEEIRREAPKPSAAPRPPVPARTPPEDIPAPEKSPFSPGGVLAHGWYVITREIGSGGMATVYLARDVRHDRWVVVKVLRPEVALTVGVEGFLREIRIAASLQHPHVVPVFDSGAIDGRLYFVMPMVEGESLRARLERDGPLPLGTALRIAREIADALAYAHKQGIVHLDIKPENVLLTGEPGVADTHAMIADFGIARAIARSSAEEHLPETGVVVGSPSYVSPEQVFGEANVDGRSDIYSLGCVVYEMLAGTPPFVGTTLSAVLAKHVDAPIPRLRVARPDVPAHVEDGVAHALAKLPADRFECAEDFAEALQGTSRDTESRGRRDSLSSVVNAVTKSRLFRVATIAAGIFLAVGLAAGAWYEVSPNGKPRASNTAVATFPKTDVAVLYFEDRSSDHSLQYLADGLTGVLIDQIGAVPALHVTSRNAVAPSRHASGLRTDSIGRALRVGTVIRGSVARVASGLQLKIEAIDAASGQRVAGSQVEQSEPNAIWLQDTLAQAATRILRARLGELLPNLESNPGTRSPEAWDARQRATGAILDFEWCLRAGDTTAALGKLAEADSDLADVETLDEFWTEPIVQRAQLAYLRARILPVSDPRALREIDLGLTYVKRVLRGEPNDAFASEMRGTLNYVRWMYNLAPNAAAADSLLRSAEQDLVAAVTRDPRRAAAWNVLSHLRLNTGNLRGATTAAENAIRLDPFLPNADFTVQRLLLLAIDMGLFDEAKKWCDVGHTRFTSSTRFRNCHLWLNAIPGPVKPNVRDVWLAYDEFMRASGTRTHKYDELKGRLIVALGLLQAGQRDSALAIVGASELNRTIDPGGELSNLAVIVYSKAGVRDSALALTARLIAADPQLASRARTDRSWWLKELRADPGYQALIRPRR
jgi:eukaryotic-like serine/threonine-protein kinase